MSLKNIYRLLVYNDFPIYSDRVISKKQKKGQTLLRFWQDTMLQDYCTLPYGAAIWRDDGRRNRLFSNLCNRNDDLKYYHEYARELADQISPQTLLSQVRRFEDFLQSREYNHQALEYRVKGFLNVLKADECVTDAIRAQLTALSREMKASCAPEEKLFCAACLLTVMSLYAAAGTAMGDRVMAVLREDSCSAAALRELRFRKEEENREGIHILTAHTGLLQSPTLSKDRFFGREAALFDLRDLVTSGKKCLISGIGGVGKTELLRQLIRRCVEEHLVDKLAVIPYRTDLAESLLYAFPELRQPSQEETLNFVLHRLEEEARDGSLLVLVDNVAGTPENDTGLAGLAVLPCTVMLTSRRRELAGFETYPLSVPNADACALIFRDNYGSPLTEDDRKELQTLLSHPDFCHPLTLRLLARAARSKNWSVADLRRSLRESTGLTWMEEGRQIRLERVLAQLYPASRIPEGCNTLIQLFTLLPRDSYPADILRKYFPQLFSGEDALTANLSELVSRSLLEQDSSGYSMHPVVAQCLRQKSWPEERLEPFLAGLRPWLRDVALDIEGALNQQWIGQLFIHMTRCLTGSISQATLLTLMDAIEMQNATLQQGKAYHSWLSQLLRHCPDRDDTLEVAWNRLLCLWQMADAETVQALFEQQRENRTVPLRRYLDLCGGFSHQFQMSNPKQTERMLQAILDTEDAPPRYIASAYRDLAVLAHMNGQPEAALSMAKAGVEFISQHAGCGDLQVFETLLTLASLYLVFGQGQEAKAILDELAVREKLLTLTGNRITYLNALSIYETNFGDLEIACQLCEEHLRLADFYQGKTSVYYAGLGQYANILLRLKRYDQAKTAYEEILAYGKDHVYYNLTRNNYAVLLLDMGKPEEAIPHILKVLSVSRTQGGIALGEALRNLARAQGMLGQFDQERESLQEAVPLLEAAYGSDHPRPTAARARLSQLQAQQA